MARRTGLSRLATVLAVALGLLTPMAANMVGARAGAPLVSTTRAVARVAAIDPAIDHRPTVLLRRPVPSAVGRQLALVDRWTNVLVRVPRTLPALARPRGGAAQVGVVPGGSKYYGFPIVAWVEEISADGRWGRVELPYTWPRREGWIWIRGLERSTTRIRVEVDLSSHTVTVRRFGKVLFRVAGATGSPSSPTPPGDYFVTDRVAFPAGGALGSFAFGISGIQPRLPAGWSGGNQLAIHGTNQPWSIGRSVSAGCVRVSEATLDRLLPLLAYGTPVVVRP